MNLLAWDVELIFKSVIAFRHFEVCIAKAGGVQPITESATGFIQLTVKGLDCDPLVFFVFGDFLM